MDFIFPYRNITVLGCHLESLMHYRKRLVVVSRNNTHTSINFYKTFPKSLKVNVIARLELEPVYLHVAVQHVRRYATGTEIIRLVSLE